MAIDLKRRKLALRIFGVLVMVNGVLWLLFAPTTPASLSPMAPAGHVELRIRGQAHAPLIPGARVLLGHSEVASLGPATVLRLDGDAVLIAVPESLYRHHHVRLATLEWSLLPYLDGMLTPQVPNRIGVRYEIAY